MARPGHGETRGSTLSFHDDSVPPGGRCRPGKASVLPEYDAPGAALSPAGRCSSPAVPWRTHSRPSAAFPMSRTSSGALPHENSPCRMHKKSPAFRFPYGSGRGFIISGAVMLLGRHNAALVLVLHKLLDLIALQERYAVSALRSGRFSSPGAHGEDVGEGRRRRWSRPSRRPARPPPSGRPAWRSCR